MRTTRPQAIAVLILAALPISGCAAQTAPRNTSAAQEDGFPPGTYTRTLTLEAGMDLGFDPAALDEVLGADGELDTELAVEDGEWTLYMLDESGGREVGDFGTYTFEDGRFVTLSENDQSVGRLIAYKWTLDGAALELITTEVDGEPPAEPIERIMTEGTYTGAEQ